MHNKTTRKIEDTSTAVPRIEIPPVEPVTSDEIERRQKLIARARKRRANIGPIDIPTDDLLHEARREER